MATGRLIPGVGLVIETDSTGRLLPGHGLVIETESAGASPQTVVQAGIASTAAIGTPKVNLSVLSAGAIASTAAIGEPSVDLSILAAGIASGSAVGTPTLLVPQSIVVDGIASTVAIGEPVLSVAGGLQTITVGGIASTVAIGGAQVALELVPSGIASTAGVGEPQLNLRVLAAGGIASGAVVGDPVVVAPLAIVVAGIASTVAIGTPRLTRAGDEQQDYRGRGARGLLDQKQEFGAEQLRAIDELHEARRRQQQGEPEPKVEPRPVLEPGEPDAQPRKARGRKSPVLPAEVIARGVGPDEAPAAVAPTPAKPALARIEPAKLGARATEPAPAEEQQPAAPTVNEDEFVIVLAQLLLAA